MNSRIKPTSMGWYLIGLIFVLLLLSVSYSNNLLLIFALIFLSLTIIWVIETFQGNKNIARSQVELQDFFADESARINLPQEISITLVSKGEKFALTTDGLKGLKRGHFEFDSIIATTTKPFGLFEYQEKAPMSLDLHVYPMRKHLASNSQGSVEADERDLTELAKYFEGSPNRIHWKHFAKTHELVTKEFTGSLTPDLIIEIEDHPSEEMLSHAAYEIHHAHLTNKKFLLKIRNEEISAYVDALKRLSLC